MSKTITQESPVWPFTILVRIGGWMLVKYSDQRGTHWVRRMPPMPKLALIVRVPA